MKNIFKKSWGQAKKVVAKGNMFMLAIGLLIGSAFGTLVNSLANDLIMQAISKAAGFNGIKFMSWGTTRWMNGNKISTISTGKDVNGQIVDLLPANGIMYGKFLGALISFLIIAFFIFVVLLTVYIIINYKNKDKKEEKPAPTNEEKILNELVKLNKNLSTKKTTTKKTTTKKKGK